MLLSIGCRCGWTGRSGPAGWSRSPSSHTTAVLGLAADRTASPRHRADRLQNGPVHLFGVEGQPSGVCLHDRDAADETLAARPFLFQLGLKLSNLILEVSLLDGPAGQRGVFPLPLFGRVDLCVQSVLLQRRRTDAQRRTHASGVQWHLLWPALASVQICRPFRQGSSLRRTNRSGLWHTRFARRNRRAGRVTD